MPHFLKIDTQMYPAERIAKIDLNAKINGSLGVEVVLHGVQDAFQYTGDYASLAYDVLHDAKPTVAPPIFPAIQVLDQNGQPLAFSSIVLLDGTEITGSIKVTDQVINVNDIEWIDLNVNFAPNVNGVEVRVATDAPGTSRQFTGDAASVAYDAFVALAGEQATAAQ